MTISPAPTTDRSSRMPILVGLGLVGLVAVTLAGALVVGRAGGAHGPFSPTGSMTTGRYGATATALPDGRVLIAGGYGNGSNSPMIASAELYDRATGTFSPMGSMTTARAGHTATLLSDGRVLIAGGRSAVSGGSYSSLTSAELYDPATGTFSPIGSMSVARFQYTATLLQDGRVLVAGGEETNGEVVASAELYDPTTGSFRRTGSMAAPRYWHTAALLSDGRVLIAGGDDGSKSLASAELYDPGTGGFSAAGSMASDRFSQAATLLSSGRVLIAGGGQSPQPDVVRTTASAELFQP